MTDDDRRYDEDEVREIFRQAADDRAGPPARTDDPRSGLTLPELQAIGREVGLDPGRIADAAAALELRRGDAVQRRSLIGAPLAVGRSAELHRPLTDDEWAVLVGEIRETFGARGRVVSQGGLREWSNGNLHVVQEATESGHRLRLHTVKESGLNADRIGIALLGIAVVILAVFALTGQLTDDLYSVLVIGGLGAAALGSNVLLLPPWARARERQMEHIAARARALTAPEQED